MAIELVEGALQEQAAVISAPFGLQAEPFPENPDAYRMTHPKGVVLVVYKRSAYAPSIASDAMAQPREMIFELVILIRNLRSHKGAYGVLDALRSGLAGWVAPQATRGCRIVSDEFRGHEEGVWQWGLSVAVPSISVPSKPPADPVDPEGAWDFGNLQTFSSYPEFP